MNYFFCTFAGFIAGMMFAMLILRRDPVDRALDCHERLDRMVKHDADMREALSRNLVNRYDALARALGWEYREAKPMSLAGWHQIKKDGPWPFHFSREWFNESFDYITKDGEGFELLSDKAWRKKKRARGSSTAKGRKGGR